MAQQVSIDTRPHSIIIQQIQQVDMLLQHLFPRLECRGPRALVIGICTETIITVIRPTFELWRVYPTHYPRHLPNIILTNNT
jgi:hypothetical protein